MFLMLIRKYMYPICTKRKQIHQLWIKQSSSESKTSCNKLNMQISDTLVIFQTMIKKLRWSLYHSKINLLKIKNPAVSEAIDRVGPRQMFLL